MLCDSTWIALLEKLQNIYPGFGGDASNASCKLQVVYDFLNGQINTVKLTDGTTNDTLYSFDLLSMLSKGTLLLTDLGYFSTKFFYAIQELGAYFISRLKADVSIFNCKTQEKINFVKFLRKFKS